MLGGVSLNTTGVSGFNAASIVEAKYLLLELAIVEIKEGESIQKYSRQFVDNLSIEDGDLLLRRSR